jgi:hypothetical protein
MDLRMRAQIQKFSLPFSWDPHIITDLSFVGAKIPVKKMRTTGQGTLSDSMNTIEVYVRVYRSRLILKC